MHAAMIYDTLFSWDENMVPRPQMVESYTKTDGNTLYLETSPQHIVDILKNARQPMLAVCLTDTVRRVRANIEDSTHRNRPVRNAVRPSRWKSAS